MWEGTRRDPDACRICRRLGFQNHGKEVCNETGAECAFESRPQPPRLLGRAALVWMFWQRIQTQWQFGPAGPTGLFYAGVVSLAGALGFDLDEETFDLIQSLEVARLNEIEEHKEASPKT